MDYKKAGVDIEAGYQSVELMKKYASGGAWRFGRFFRGIFPFID